MVQSLPEGGWEGAQDPCHQIFKGQQASKVPLWDQVHWPSNLALVEGGAWLSAVSGFSDKVPPQLGIGWHSRHQPRSLQLG